MQVGRIDLTQGFFRLRLYCSSVCACKKKQGVESPCRDAASFPTRIRRSAVSTTYLFYSTKFVCEGECVEHFMRSE